MLNPIPETALLAHPTRSLPRRLLALCVPLVCAASLSAQQAAHGALELTSGLHRPLYALPDDAAETEAKGKLAANPADRSLWLALSHAQAARRQYREAVATCSHALAHFPNAADLYLERGHRELGLREFPAAVVDLQKAVALDPRSLEAHYHLGLGHYFQRQFAEAATHFTDARDLSTTDDSLIDCSAWLYASLRRAGKPAEAAAVLTRITPATINTEDHLLFYLRLLRFYQGKLSAESITPPPPKPGDTEAELSFDTVTYGLGNWHLYNHDGTSPEPFFRSVVAGEAWNAWGFIGSENELSQAH